MLCRICREDLDVSHFDSKKFLHARVYCDIPMCFECSNLDNVGRTNKRESALDALGQVTKRTKIVQANILKLSKSSRKKLAHEKKAARAAKREAQTADKEWKSLSHADRRALLLDRRPASELVLERELIRQNVRHHAQHAAGGYWLDFRIMPGHLGVEVDGGYHFTPEQKLKDAERTTFLERQGWSILRFTNEEVNSDVEQVVKRIIAVSLGKIALKKHVNPERIVVIPPKSSPLVTSPLLA